MAGKLPFVLLCLLGLLRQAHAQEVIIAREERPQVPRAEAVTHPQVKAETHVEKGIAMQLANPQSPEKKVLPAVSNNIVQAPKQERAAPQPSKTKVLSSQPKPELHGGQAGKTASANVPVQKQGAITTPPLSTPNHSVGAVSLQPVNNHFETGFIKLADGFDFPVGKPDAQGYYKARGFRSRGHLGEDWDGVRGGDTDLGDPIYSIGHGLVVFARDCHMGWGNVIIVRHSYRENGVVKNIDALYGHLDTMLVHRGQTVTRGQKIATMGTAHGLYDAHLHLEIRKNIEVGMSRTAFAQDFSNYYDPSQFVALHRHLSTAGGTYRVAMNTFVRDEHINWNKARNYSHSQSRGGTGESAAALKKAIASQH
jgi:murein DD-endopeptidase MepM/ murein hydrolase activator NlpD